MYGSRSGDWDGELKIQSFYRSPWKRPLRRRSRSPSVNPISNMVTDTPTPEPLFQSHYASHPLVGTLGIPLVIYPGLKLNFLRPRFLNRIHDFQPDVVHFVDPVWLGGQTMKAMEKGFAGAAWDKRTGYEASDELEGATVASYHT